MTALDIREEGGEGYAEDYRPTYQELLLWRDRLGSDWLSSSDNTYSLEEQLETDEALYFQNYDTSAVEGDPYAVKTGSAPEDVDSAVDVLVPNRILVKVIPPSGTKKQKDRSDRLAKAGRAIIEAWRRPSDEIRKVVLDMVHKRYAVARVVFDERMWPQVPDEMTLDERKERLREWQERHLMECPIVLDLRPPRYCRWREYRGRMLVVVEDYHTTVLEAKHSFRFYPEALAILRSRKDFDEVRVSDVWFEEWRAIFIEDRPIFPGESGVLPHGYPEIPYVTAAFRELTYDEPSKRFRGVLSNTEGLYPAESRVLSMHLTMLAFNSWRTHVGHTVDGREIRIIPGRYIDIDKNRGEYLELLRGDPVPDELLRTEAVVDQLIQRNSATATPRGTENSRSAQQLYAMQAIRGLKTESARDALARFIERALGLALMEIELFVQDSITLPVPVRTKDSDFGAVTLTPRDILGYYTGFRVSFGRRLDPASMEQAKNLQGFSQNRWISWETSHELSELIEDISLEEDRLMLEGVDRLPFNMEIAALEDVKATYGEGSWQYEVLRRQIELGRVQAQRQSQQQPSNLLGRVTGQDLNRGTMRTGSLGGVASPGQPAGGISGG